MRRTWPSACWPSPWRRRGTGRCPAAAGAQRNTASLSHSRKVAIKDRDLTIKHSRVYPLCWPWRCVAFPEIDEGSPLLPTFSPGDVLPSLRLTRAPHCYLPLALEVCSLPLRLMRAPPPCYPPLALEMCSLSLRLTRAHYCTHLLPWRCAACPWDWWGPPPHVTHL